MTLASPFLLAVLALQQLQTGPGEVRGTVHGEWNGQLTPLPHALVEVAGAGRTRAVLADSTGQYVVTGVPAGLRRLRVVHIGFDGTPSAPSWITSSGASDTNPHLARFEGGLLAAWSDGSGDEDAAGAAFPSLVQMLRSAVPRGP